MERKRKFMQVVIAHPIPEEQLRIASLLKQEGMFRVRHMTHDGLDCLREVVATQPDLLIIDTVLDKIDGLEVLRRLKEFPLRRTKCLLLTSYQGYLKDHALSLDADYCLLAPFADGVLLEAVRMLMLPSEPSASDRDIDAQTIRLLRDIGVPNRLKAYPYVLAGVRILYRDPGLVRRRRVVKDLYGAVAQHFGVTPLNVERAMRTLSNRAFDKGDRESLTRCFNPADVQQGHIINTDFLVAITRQVTQNLAAASDSSEATNH